MPPAPASAGIPQTTTRPSAHPKPDLPPSVETAYYRKCIELRRRINEIEDNNDSTRLRIRRLNRSITKMRLERAFLLEALNKRMEYNLDDSDRSSSPPPTPTGKPLRGKRGGRKATPPAQTANLGVPESGAQQAMMGQMNPMSSAQSTPDPSSRPNNPFFSTIVPASGAAAESPSSHPHGNATVNGNSENVLPPLSEIPGMQPHGLSATREGGYYDAAYEDRDRRGPEDDTDYPSGRPRASSGANGSPPPDTHNGANGERAEGQDTEMPDADSQGSGQGGFTAVNR